jgi:hypothetical protein
MGRRDEKRRTPGAVRGGIARDERSVLFGGARRRPALAALAVLVAVLVLALVVLVVRPAIAQVIEREPTPVAAPTPAPAVPAPGAPADLPPLGTATPDPAGEAALSPDSGTAPSPFKAVRWRSSRALGSPNAGRLVRGVQLPSEGLDWFTWDWQLEQSPNRGFRRWGTDALVRTIVMTLAEYRYADPDAPRVGVADLSRTSGGSFGAHWGGLGHASHQNGLDVDVLYPRKDGLPRPAARPSQVDRKRAQDLVDRFVAAGAQYVFVGYGVRLKGPKGVVQAIPHHDDHLHVRIPRP